MQPECRNDDRIASFARVQLDLDHLTLNTIPGQPGWLAGEFYFKNGLIYLHEGECQIWQFSECSLHRLLLPNSKTSPALGSCLGL